MITTNETGPDVGRCLFTLFESGQAGVQRIDIVGHSMGGMTVMQFCGDHPEVLGERVARLRFETGEP